MGRGMLTDAVQAAATATLGRSITQHELRLMPYVQYCVINGDNLDPRKIRFDERAILAQWREAGLISGGASNLEVSKEFWCAMMHILWAGYVDIED